MTDEELIFEIAEACGWKRHHEKGDPGAREWWKPDGSFALAEDLPGFIRELVKQDG